MYISKHSMRRVANVNQEEGDVAVMPPIDSDSERHQQLETLGVSVHHLQHVLLKEVCQSKKTTEAQSLKSRFLPTSWVSCGGGGGGALLSRQSTIYEIENLNGPPGFIRKKGSKITCPLDGKKGAAYVHCLKGEDHVGPAKVMLSYSWGYTIGDIIDTLADYCVINELDPKRTYVWICCLCINQHRLLEQFTVKVDQVALFAKRVKIVGHLLSMMAPWKEPLYLTRTWCLYELFTAHSNGCKVDIVMPPVQKALLECDVLGDNQNGINTLFGELAKIRIQHANSSVEKERRDILILVESSVGFAAFDRRVNQLLRNWVQRVILQLVESRAHEGSGAFAGLCNWIGVVMYKSGEHGAAVDLHKKAIEIQKNTIGIEHADTATSYHNLGVALEAHGDLDGALQEHQQSLAIRKEVLGTSHPDTANSYAKIGNVLRKLGDFDGAIRAHNTCLALVQSVLGRDDPATAPCFGRIATVLYDQGNFEGALQNYQKCLAIRERALGTDHPETKDTQKRIVLMLESKGCAGVSGCLRPRIPFI